MPEPTTDTAVLDTDNLPPTQYLILEVLAARYRTGEHAWTFPARVRNHLDALADLGLVGCKSGIVPRTALAWFTDAGRAAALLEGYEPAAVDAAYAAGREAAAQAIREYVDHRSPRAVTAGRSRDDDLSRRALLMRAAEIARGG